MSVASLGILALSAVSSPAEALPSTPLTAVPVTTAPAPSPLFQEEEEPLNEWHGTVNFGATYTSGNTRDRTASLAAEANRRGENDLWNLRAWWTYTSTRNGITDREYGGAAEYNYFATDRLYYLGIAGAGYDLAQNIDLRYFIGAGLGYQFIENEKTTWSGSAAITYFNQELIVEPATDVPDDSYVALRLASKLGHQFSEDTRFDQTAEAFPSIEDSDDIYARVDSKLSTSLTANMVAGIQHILDWNRNALSGVDPVDHKVLLTVGWVF